MKKNLITTGAIAALGLVLAGCAASPPASEPASDTAPAEGQSRIVLTTDGALFVLDASTLELQAELPIDGFNRVSSAGDASTVLVVNEEGFRVLDTGADDSSEPVLTDLVFEAEAAGHVVRHAGRTILFADGTGDTTILDSADLATATDTLPETEVVPALAAHHGVSIVLEDNTMLTTIGDENGRTGVRVLDAERTEVTRNEECPAVHGEGTVADEVVVFGCENGVLVYVDGAFTKLTSPDAFGRVGNMYVSEDSPIAISDYKSDPDAEGYFLSQVMLIDTEALTANVVALPEGVEYTWRNIVRSSADEAVILGSDGALHLLDVATGEITASYPVISAWQSPVEWQDAHPSLAVLDGVAYVTDSANATISAVDLATGDVLATAELPSAPNEMAIVTG
jgi:hypothetical protein